MLNNSTSSKSYMIYRVVRPSVNPNLGFKVTKVTTDALDLLCVQMMHVRL